MKKATIAIIIIIAILACVVAGAISYYWSCYESADASGAPPAPMEAAGKEIMPYAADLTVPVLSAVEERLPEAIDVLAPVLGDRLFKELFCVIGSDGSWQAIPEGTDLDMQDPAIWLGMLGDAPYTLDIKLPDTMNWDMNLEYEDTSGIRALAFSYNGPGSPGDGSLNELLDEEIILTRPGGYTLYVHGTLEKEKRSEPYGVFHYRAYFELKNPDPVFTVGRTELEQGDIFSMKLENVPVGIVPVIESDLGAAIFTEGLPENEYGERAPQVEGLTSWYAMVPVTNSRAVGEYPVSVYAGELVYETVVSVREFDFDFQNLIIDTSVPSVAQAITYGAIVEFNEKVLPLFPIITEERYWDGMFIMPVDLGEDGFISTEFGQIRITNGDYGTRRSHNGMDLAVSTGTPIHAGNSGRVLLAEFLLNTGNTIIIDHGGGLKGIYYHLDSITAVAGAMVEKGEFIGTVGTTGYSTGPHLHYEMRIGEQPVSPAMLSEPGAGLYSANVPVE